MLRIGDEVDRFTVERRIAEGGMATVYAVRHRVLGSLHALKVLHVNKPAIRRRLIQEGQAQANLRHPNVVPVTDILNEEGTLCLVMEYVDGPSLAGFMEQGPPDAEQIEQLATGLFAGLAAAHRAGIVHRDLKPANVLVSNVDGVLVPRITDFGVAKILRTSDADSTLTHAGAALGTPQYMSPEQIGDSAGVDARADVFAMGVLLYELLTGQSPWRGDDDLTTLFTRITRGEFLPVSQLCPDIPARREDAIRGALVADRDRRIPSIQAMRETWFGRSMLPPEEPIKPARDVKEAQPTGASVPGVQSFWLTGALLLSLLAGLAWVAMGH